MKTRPLFVLFSIALVVSLALFLHDSDRSTSAVPAAGSGTSSARRPTPALEWPGGAEASAPAGRREVHQAAAEVQAPVPLLTMLVGRIVDQGGQALAGVPLRFVLARELWSVEEVDPTRFLIELRASTGEDGRFSVPDVPAVGLGGLLFCSLEGFSPLRKPVPQLHSGRLTDVGDVVLTRAGSVSGVVVDRSGKLVGGAAILWTRTHPHALAQAEGSEAGQARSDGSFHVEGLPTGEVRLCAYVEGNAALWSPPLNVSPGSTLDGVELTIERGVSMRGFIHELESGRGVPGIVYAYSSAGARVAQVQSDAAGRFVLDGLVLGSRIIWEVRAPGHAYATSKDGFGGPNVLRVEPDLLEVDFAIPVRQKTLAPIRAVDGASGLPIPGAQVRKLPPLPRKGEETARSLILGTTDGNGVFSPEGVPDAAGALWLWAEGYTERTFHFPLATSGEDHVVELARDAGVTIEVSSNGAPLAGARLELLRARRSIYANLGNGDFHLTRAAVTDREGRASFSAPAVGSYLLRLEVGGEVRVLQGLDVVSGEPLHQHVEADALGILSGSVSGGARDDVVAACLRGGDRRLQAYAFWSHVDRDGSYEIRGMPPGTYTVSLLRGATTRERPSIRVPLDGIRVDVPREGARLDLQSLGAQGDL